MVSRKDPIEIRPFYRPRPVRLARTHSCGPELLGRTRLVRKARLVCRRDLRTCSFDSRCRRRLYRRILIAGDERRVRREC